MVALHFGDHALEHGIGMGIRTNSQVLLAELLRLPNERNIFLRFKLLSAYAQTPMFRCTYKLLSERDLLELQLGNGGMSRAAEQHSGCQQSALHDGQLVDRLLLGDYWMEMQMAAAMIIRSFWRVCDDE